MYCIWFIEIGTIDYSWPVLLSLPTGRLSTPEVSCYRCIRGGKVLLVFQLLAFVFYTHDINLFLHRLGLALRTLRLWALLTRIFTTHASARYAANPRWPTKTIFFR